MCQRSNIGDLLVYSFSIDILFKGLPLRHAWARYYRGAGSSARIIGPMLSPHSVQGRGSACVYEDCWVIAGSCSAPAKLLLVLLSKK
jgi:hypothetical protein